MRCAWRWSAARPSPTSARRGGRWPCASRARARAPTMRRASCASSPDRAHCPARSSVNRLGRRFVNEAVNYHDIVRAFHVFDPGAFTYPNRPALVPLRRVLPPRLRPAQRRARRARPALAGGVTKPRGPSPSAAASTPRACARRSPASTSRRSRASIRTSGAARRRTASRPATRRARAARAPSGRSAGRPTTRWTCTWRCSARAAGCA